MYLCMSVHVCGGGMVGLGSSYLLLLILFAISLFLL